MKRFNGLSRPIKDFVNQPLKTCCIRVIIKGTTQAKNPTRGLRGRQWANGLLKGGNFGIDTLTKFLCVYTFLVCCYLKILVTFILFVRRRV